MARIRTIKPEFQQSQSMGNVSRDARLAFVLLWPQCDDAGRIRGVPRMLANILFPYDTDAAGKIESWLAELEREGCITRYERDGAAYIAVTNWHHQKIERPSPSKFPPPPNGKSRGKTKASPHRKLGDHSPLDQGSRIEEGIKDQGKDQGEGAPTLRSASSPPSRQPDLLEPEGEATSDIEKAVDIYNIAAAGARHAGATTGWAECVRLTPARRRSLNARLSEAGGRRGWATAMQKAMQSAFLRGDNDRGFTPAGIGFFLEPEKFARLMEGMYDDRPKPAKAGGVLERALHAADIARGLRTPSDRMMAGFASAAEADGITLMGPEADNDAA